MPDILSSLQDGLLAKGLPRLRQRKVRLLLGTDRDIGRDSKTIERRVGIVPQHVQRLKAFIEAIGGELELLVVRGAGVRAGCSDDAYISAGAEIVTKEELPDLANDILDPRPTGAVDVVHALKEPSHYEAEIPSSFLRIGAVHTGDFSDRSGLAQLLAKGCNTIFDGSNIGAEKDFRIPIRAAMSKFAGRIGAEWIIDSLERTDRTGSVVVVGGGNAGMSAVMKLVEANPVRAIHVLEDASNPDRFERIANQVSGHKNVSVVGLRGVDHVALVSALEEAVGLILAPAKGKKKSPRVVRAATLGNLAQDAVIVDISIDEGGAIEHPGIQPAWTHEEIITHLTPVIRELGFDYRAVPNMPTVYSVLASPKHGEAVLPYLAALLFLCAREGGPQGTVMFLQNLSVVEHAKDPATRDSNEVLAALCQDLRNGMAFHRRNRVESSEKTCGRCGQSSVSDSRIVVEDFVSDRRKIFKYLWESKSPFEFRIRAAGLEGITDDEAKAKAETKAEFDCFPGPVQECLATAVDKGIDCTIISHPGKDGTHTEAAAVALGVIESYVLKCLIFKRADEYVAVVCEGNKNKKVDVDRLGDIVGSRDGRGSAWRLASVEQVFEITQRPIGAIPVVQVFDFPEIRKVIVSDGLMGKEMVYGSAGSEQVGMGFSPKVLKRLGGHVASVTKGG